MHDDTSPTTPDEPFFLRALGMLRRRVVLAVVVCAMVLASTVAFARYLPDLFRASAVVLVERQLPESVVRAAVSGELENRLHVIKQEVLSRARLTNLITRFDLYADLRARGDMDSALEEMRRDIEVELTGPEQVSGRTKTVTFNLTFTGNTRETVAEVTNAIADFYVAQNDQMRSEEASRTTRFLETELESAKARLNQNEKQVETYTSQHVGELPQQVDVNLATLERLNTQLRINGERQIRALDQRDKLFEVPRTAPTPSLASGASPVDARLEKLQHDLAQLDGFPDKHPDVRRIKDEIAALEGEVAPRPTEPAATGADTTARADAPSPSRARTVATLDAEFDSLKAEEATLHQNITTIEQRLEGVPYRQNEFAVLSRGHQATSEQYESLLKRYEEAQLAESMETKNQGERFRILEGAVPPPGPSAPNRLRLLIMGLFLAALAAGLSVLFVEQCDTSFHSVDDVRRFTNVPVLVAIPRLGPWPARGWPRLVLFTVSALVAFMLVGAVSAYVARDNEVVVRLLVRGG